MQMSHEPMPARPAGIRGATVPQEFDTPSDAIIRTKAPIATTDSIGRHFKVRYLGPADKMKMFRILGKDLADNQTYMGHATLAWAVSEFDGDPMPFPQSVRETEAVMSRLGDEGAEAVANAYVNSGWIKLATVDLDEGKN
jgi:hypothetical protein